MLLIAFPFQLMSRKNLAILLVGALLFPIVISYTAFLFYKYQVQEEVKALLAQTADEEQFILLKFSKDEAKTKLKWEDATEFEYNGQMYDVIKSFENGDSIFFWVWCDNEETSLKKHYHALLSNLLYNNTQQKENSKKLIDFFKTLFFQNVLLKIMITDEEAKIFVKNSSDYFVYLSVLSPPPKGF